MKDYITLPELSDVLPHLDKWIFESQKLYEQAIKEYIRFKEANINAEIEYNKRMASYITTQQGKGDKVTVLKEKAKNDCAAEYKIMLEAEAKKAHYEMYIKAFENRINMLKILMRVNIGNVS